MRRILDENKIIARDQKKVFVERASAGRQSPRDVEEEYGLEIGKGNAFVEFDIEPDLLRIQYNRRLQTDEFYIAGDVDLAVRDPIGCPNL